MTCAFWKHRDVEKLYQIPPMHRTMHHADLRHHRSIPEQRHHKSSRPPFQNIYQTRPRNHVPQNCANPPPLWTEQNRWTRGFGLADCSAPQRQIPLGYLRKQSSGRPKILLLHLAPNRARSHTFVTPTRRSALYQLPSGARYARLFLQPICDNPLRGSITSSLIHRASHEKSRLWVAGLSKSKVCPHRHHLRERYYLSCLQTQQIQQDCDDFRNN